MDFFWEFTHHISLLFSHYGYLVVFLAIAIESIGIPFPGESTLITASIYTGTTHHLNIVGVVLAAAAGAIIGDNIGYFIGKKGGYFLLRRYGKYIKVDDKKMKVGQYLFRKYGAEAVFFGRFIAILRTWAAFLAGVNDMRWKRFLFFNAAGGIIWANFYGTAGYILGKEFNQFDATLRVLTFIIGMIIFLAITLYLHKNQKRLEAKAEKELPGSIEKYR